MFGRHRLEGALRLHERHVQPGGQWPKDVPDRDIPLLVFPANTPDDVVKLYEIVENLHRFELTPEEKAIHSVKYAELLKRTGAVQSAKSKGAKARENAKHGVKPLDAMPTATEKLAKEENISRQAVHDRFKKAKELAESEGVKSDARSLEEADAEELGRIAEAAEKAALKPKPKKSEQTVTVKYGGKVISPKSGRNEIGLHFRSPLHELLDALDAVLKFPLDSLPDRLPPSAGIFGRIEEKVTKASDLLKTVKERLAGAKERA